MRGSPTYLDPETGILANLVGARTQDDLSCAESDFAIVRQIQLSEQPISGAFDLGHLCAIHAHLFGDVYAFAGALRTVNLHKHCDPTQHFAPARLLPELAARLFAELAADRQLRGLDRDAFVNGASTYFTALNHLHPFREGNGRTLRVFLSTLAAHAGYRLDWSRISRADNLAASRSPITNARHLIDRVTLQPATER